MIRDELAARRLARAILDDLVNYQGPISLEGSPSLEEGRALFGTRIEPSLVYVFDDELRQRRSGSPRSPQPVGESMDPTLGRVQPTGAPIALFVALGAMLAMLAVAASVFFLLR